jgi:hypothetical protein
MEQGKKDGNKAAPRRPYVTPRVEESAEFEHLILACTHSVQSARRCDPAFGGVTSS